MIRIDIVNDGKGSTLIGDYDVTLYLPDGVTTARVEHFRRSNGWDALVWIAVQKLREQMKGGE